MGLQFARTFFSFSRRIACVAVMLTQAPMWARAGRLTLAGVLRLSVDFRAAARKSGRGRWSSSLFPRTKNSCTRVQAGSTVCVTSLRRMLRYHVATSFSGVRIMANDILLEGPGHPDWVVVQSPVLKLEGHDVLIDSSERRKSNTPFRRALVHDQGDGLTVNFANDYPGGVLLNGVVAISPNPPAQPLHIGGLPTVLPAVAVHGDITYETTGFALVGGGTPRVTVSITHEINALHGLIDDLTARVAALEKK